MAKPVVQKVYIDEDPNMPLEDEKCPECAKLGKTYNLRYMYVNLEEAVYKCSSPYCMYPFQNFKYKNYTDKTVYRYKFAAPENGEEQNGQTVDVSWIDSLPINSNVKNSPLKRQASTDSMELMLDAMLDTSETDAFSNAMDQLEAELNDILSSHCKDSEQSEPITSSTPIEIPTQRQPSKKPDKPRKLSKVYDFIKQKTGALKDTSNSLVLPNQSTSSFKVPTQSAKESMTNYKQQLQSPKKHRSGRSSKRLSKPLPQGNIKSPNSKEQKVPSDVDRSQALSFLNHVEKFNSNQCEPIDVPFANIKHHNLKEQKVTPNADRSQAISFLSHIENLNKTQCEPVNVLNTDPVLFKIEILPHWNVNETQMLTNNPPIKIKVEGNSSTYNGHI